MKHSKRRGAVHSEKVILMNFHTDSCAGGYVSVCYTEQFSLLKSHDKTNFHTSDWTCVYLSLVGTNGRF